MQESDLPFLYLLPSENVEQRCQSLKEAMQVQGDVEVSSTCFECSLAVIFSRIMFDPYAGILSSC